MSRKLLQTETVMSREDAAEKLHNLADKISEGRVELETGDNSVELHPAERLEFELDVEEESDGDISIEVEIEWSKEQKEEKVEIK